MISRANKYIDETQPWLLAKDESKHDRLGTVLYNLLESIRIALIILAPTMPTLAARANQQLNIFEHPDSLKWEEARTWGLTQAGKLVSRGPALFPRLDLKALDEDSPEVKTAEEDTKEKKEEVI